ncbi:hypothetical protein Tsubulata_030832 [Turnera subulata]|uniref:Pentacotripeptide-repeat region of PRORP domain-containing protein n=1 Tax=Turnera subulata TaxID=218843 RepID=A0A9Q0FYP5_9ROSI|nr:hypothetical protein Tsubulata_030832 [Turnera subulata]
MAALLLPYQTSTLTLLLLHTHSSNPNHLKSQLFLYAKRPSKTSSTSSPPSFSVFCTPPTFSLSHSSPPIFPPFLQEEEEEGEQQQEEEEEEDEVNEEEVADLKYPILRFFDSQTLTTQDPARPGKFSFNENTDATRTRQTNPTNPEPTPLPDGVVGEIIRIARDLPENTTLVEQLGGYEGRVSEEECVEVLGLLGVQGMLMGCVYFYDWMRLQGPSLVTPAACSVLFTVMGRAGMGDVLMALFVSLPDKEGFRAAHVYNSAISGLLTCRRHPRMPCLIVNAESPSIEEDLHASREKYDDAYKVYDEMETNNVLPDHVTCSTMITLMKESGRCAKEAWEFFEKMNRKGVGWSQDVLAALVKVFCDEGLKSEALIIQTEMARKGVFANATVYNTLMDAYSNCNRVEEVEGLFAEMKRIGIKPTCSTFNILMDAYSRRMQPEVVEKLLVEMQDAGLDPNAKSYACLISAYGRQKKMSDVAADAFFRMKKVGIKPTSDSYTALIHAYSVSGCHEKACTAFADMLNEGIEPSIETYTTLLDALRHAGDTPTLMTIWKMMIRKKVKGTRVTFNILLDGLAKKGQYMEARDVISEFGKLGFEPTVMTYNMLMNAYARGGQPSKLPQLLKEMSVRELKPDSITYMTMIHAYVRVHDFKRAFYYHKMMVKSGQVPDEKSYQKLRSKLDVKAALKNKKDKSAILGIINSKKGMLKVKKKGKKDEFWKNKKKRLRVHNIDGSGE